jgi:hypothetical protein
MSNIPQYYPDGTGGAFWEFQAEVRRNDCMNAIDAERVTWRHILFAQMSEAFAQQDLNLLLTSVFELSVLAQAWSADIVQRQEGLSP